jgi:hypothetical protein
MPNTSRNTYVCSQNAVQFIYFTALFYTKLVTRGEIIFSRSLTVKLYYFDGNKFPVEIKSYSYSNIRYNMNKSAPFIAFASLF